MRTLAVGVGNVLKADDGFGVRAAELLRADPRLPKGVKVIETGIGGMSLVQELMDGYDALVVFDACEHGAAPGTLCVVEPHLPEPGESATERRDFFCDIHFATPERAMRLAEAVGVLPRLVRVIGCQPFDTDDFRIGLHPAVEAATARAVETALRLFEELRRT